MSAFLGRAVATAAFALWIGPQAAGLSAEVALKGRELTNCKLRVSPALVEKAGSLESKLSGGLERLTDLFDRPALPGKPEFWLLKDGTEMEAVLGRFFKLTPKARAQAVKAGAYRDALRVVLILDPRTPDDWLLRALYTEHARTLMDATAPSARSLRIGWFYGGTSAYLAWMIAGEQSGLSEERTQRLVLEYYSRFFNPDKFSPLQLLEVPADWQGALQRNGAASYAQAVLTVWFLVKEKTPRALVTILKSYEREEAFSTAFERGTGWTLKQFEREIVLKLFPEVRRLRRMPEPKADSEKKESKSDKQPAEQPGEKGIPADEPKSPPDF